MKVFCKLFVLFSILLNSQISWAQQFGPPEILNPNVYNPSRFYPADFDGDGDMDYLTSSSTKVIYEENPDDGSINWPSETLISGASQNLSASAADLDGDGDPDVLVSAFSKIMWFENLGGTFGEEQIISTDVWQAFDAIAADLDGDGDLDVMSASAVDHKVALYENQGSGVFGDQQVISTEEISHHRLKAADIDDDGDLDVIAASSGDDIVLWFENLGDLNFGGEQVISSNVNMPRSIDTADLDGDGDLDLVIGYHGFYSIAWHENLGGLFGSQQLIHTETFSTSDVFCADFDADGDIDILSCSGGADKVTWNENQGDGEFNEQVVISDEANNASSVYGVDMDADGDLDAIAAVLGDNKIMWYRNLLSDGCIDPDACNYDPTAWVDDESCCYECGCTIQGALNYSPTACLDDGSCQFEVLGTVFFDENENGFMDGGENGLSLQELTIAPIGLNLISNSEGEFLTTVTGSDEYTFTLEDNPLFPFFTTPQSLTFNANEDNWNQDALFFGISNEVPAFDLEANMYSEIAGFPCDDLRSYYLCFQNNSNVLIDVQMEFHYSELFQDIVQSSLIDSLGENVAYLSFNDVLPMELICAEVILISPTVDFIGEFLNTSIQVTAFYEGDEVTFGTDSLSDELTCAYDPNDKRVFPAGYSDEHYIVNDTILEYIIRFQNTGNATATDVLIRDTLDAYLDLSTFQLLVHSHSVYTSLDANTRELQFYFQDIMLADSVNNEPESHGLVSFEIRPDDDLPLLTEINNTAAIYFDNNPPIITNTTWSTIYDCSLFEVSFTDDGALLIATEGDHYQWFFNGEPIEGANEQEYIAQENGSYSVQVGIDFPCTQTSSSIFITVTSVQDLDEQEINLFPNPMTSSAVLDIEEIQGPVLLEIYDILGKLHRSELLNPKAGNLIIERGSLSRGTYIMRLTADGEPLELKFMVE